MKRPIEKKFPKEYKKDKEKNNSMITKAPHNPIMLEKYIKSYIKNKNNQ